MIPRIKSCILRDDQGIYIIGGLADKFKVQTRRCEFIEVRTGKVIELKRLNQEHNEPSGCFHRRKMFIFSDVAIETYNKEAEEWIEVKIPKRFYHRSFEYCISISNE